SNLDDRTVSLWDRASLRETASITGLTEPAWEMAFSPDGRMLVTTGSDVSVWDVASRRRVATLTGHTGNTRGVAFSPDGRVMATSGDDHTVVLWDTNRLGMTARPAAPLGQLAAAGDGHPVAVASGRAIALLELATRAEISEFTSDKGTIKKLAISPD